MTTAITAGTAPWLVQPSVRTLLETLSAGGGRVAATGGAVRDTLLGKGGEVTDLDLVATSDVADVRRLLRGAGMRPSLHPFLPGLVFVDFGGRGDAVRHGSVRCTGDGSPGALDRDAAARDLTVNALQCDPDGVLRDAVGGMDDLAARRLRWVSDGAAAADPVRMQRYFRMGLRIGETVPDAAALAVVAREAPLAAAVDPIRLAREMLVLLDGHVPDEALAALRGMQGQGLLDVLVPGHTLDRFASYAATGDQGRIHLDCFTGMALLGAAGVPTMTFGDWRDEAVALRAATLDRRGGGLDDGGTTEGAVPDAPRETGERRRAWEARMTAVADGGVDRPGGADVDAPLAPWSLDIGGPDDP